MDLAPNVKFTQDITVIAVYADIFVRGKRAFIVYRSVIEDKHSCKQMAELKVKSGALVCDRNTEFSISLNN